jgi:hypothetical protein
MSPMIVFPRRLNSTLPDPAEAGGRGAAPRLDQYIVHCVWLVRTVLIRSPSTAEAAAWAAAQWLAREGQG